ncbi:methyltransferase, partial [Rhizobium hidalgonense]
DKVVLAKTVNAKRQQDSKDQQNLSQQPQFTVEPPQQNQAQENQSPQSSVVALQVTTNHNRAKHRYVEQSRPFLRKLGVTDAQGQIIPAMSRKWKQINKFLEIFAGALQQAGINEQDQLSVVDFGSGKGYLTFAVHDYIVQQLHQQADVTGVELRDELVKLCNVAAQQVDANGI